MKNNILAADIGGTNSRFAHFQIDGKDSLVLKETKWLATADAHSFPQLLEQLRQSDPDFPIDMADLAVIAVAGPVKHGTYSDPPYIPWDIDLTSGACNKTLPKARLINDFVAQAYACQSQVGKSARVIHTGEKEPDGTIGVIGAGTALGKALLHQVSGHGFVALPSEGGHGYFPFTSPRETAFQQFYQKKSGCSHITGNLVVSGRGLHYINWFLTGKELEPEEIAAGFTEDSETLAWAARFYGRICRDFALEVLALGGLYIAGGVAAQNPELITHADFRREFVDSPTMGDLLEKIPIFLIDDQDSGLWGAAFCGQQLLQKR